MAASVRFPPYSEIETETLLSAAILRHSLYENQNLCYFETVSSCLAKPVRSEERGRRGFFCLVSP